MKLRWVMTGVAAACLLAAALWWLRAPTVPLHSTVMPMATPPQTPLPAVPPATADSSLAARRPPKIGELAAGLGPPVWDLCGIGRVPVPPALAASAAEDPMGALPHHLGKDAFEAGLTKLVQALRAGGPRWRAAAALLGSDFRRDDPAATRAVAELARSGNDPVVAMWALSRCRGDDACALVSARRWADLEPDNGAALLELMRLQPQRREDLVRRLAAAQRFDSHFTALLATTFEAMPSDLPQYVQHSLWIGVVGIAAATSIPSFQPLTTWCRGAEQAGGERLSTCAAAARLLLAQSDTTLGTMIGLRLAEWTFLPKAEAEAQRAALRELQQQSADAFDLRDPMSCAAVARARTWFEQWARLGEVGAMRERAAAASAAAAKR